MFWGGLDNHDLLWSLKQSECMKNKYPQIFNVIFAALSNQTINHYVSVIFAYIRVPSPESLQIL